MEMARIKSEDIAIVEKTKLTPAHMKQLYKVDDEYDDYDLQMEERADAYEQNCIPSLEIEKGSHDFLARARAASSTIYAKE